MTRSHLEVPFAFAHEPIYSEVIKSEAGIRWCRLVGERQDAAREAPLWAIWWSFYCHKNKLNAITGGKCKKGLVLTATIDILGSLHIRHIDFFFNDMHKKVISLSLHCQW